VAHCWTSLARSRVSCQYSFSAPPSWSRLLLFGLSSARLILSQGYFLLTHFFCHCTMCHEYKSKQFVGYIAFTSFMILSVCVNFICCTLYSHESDLQYGVTDRHCPSTNGVRLGQTQSTPS